MPGYNATDADGHYIQLACNVLWQEEGQRPVIEPQESEHQLYLDFAGGITWDRAIEIAGLIMHPD